MIESECVPVHAFIPVNKDRNQFNQGHKGCKACTYCERAQRMVNTVISVEIKITYIML